MELLIIVPDMVTMKQKQKMLNEGFLEFSSTEVKMYLKGPNITGIKRRHQGKAEELIEFIMLYHNLLKTSEFIRRGLPFIARNHEEPRHEKITAWNKLLSQRGYKVDIKDKYNNEDIKKTVDFIKSEIWTKELEIDSFSNSKITDRLSEEMKEKHNIKLALSSQKIIKDIFGDDDKINNETISKIANDIAMYFGDIKGLLSDELVNYLSDDTYTHFIMNEKEINKLNDLIKEREAKR